MSKINNTTAYPIVPPAIGDLVIMSDVSDSKSTKNFQIGALNDLFIDTFVNPDATDFHIPVFNQGGVRITNSIMSQDSSPSNGVAGTKITIAGDLTLERDQSDTTLTLISDGSNQGNNNNPSIKFIQDGGAQNAAIGFNIIDDTGGGTIPGTGNRFWIVNAMDDNIGEGGITFGTAQVDGWDNAIGRFIIRGDGKGLFGHPDSLYGKTLGSQFEIYDNRDDNTTTDPSFSVYSVVDYAAPSGNEGAGGIKQILDVYNNGVFEQQEAIMLIPGTNSSDFAASTPLAFYTNSDMDTQGPSGFAGIIFDSGNWLLDGSGTLTTTDPGYQLKVEGTGLFTDQVTIPETPVAATDAASKAYVDSKALLSVSVTLTDTQVLSLSGGGSNLELIAAPGANKVIDVVSLIAYLDFGTQAYNWTGSNNKLSITTTTPVSQENGFNLTVTELNASADTYWKPEVANVPIGVNLPLSIYNTSGASVTQGDSPITFSILYRIVDFL